MTIRQRAVVVVPVFVCLLAAVFGVLAYLIAAVIGLPASLGLPLFLRGAGAVLSAAGALLMAWVWRFRDPSDVLVSTYLSIRQAVMGGRPDEAPVRTGSLDLRGPQRHVRHPMYSALVMLILGGGLAFDCAVTLLVALFFFLWFDLVVIRFEEAELRALYGEEYEAYAKAVPKLFPSWKSRWP